MKMRFHAILVAAFVFALVFARVAVAQETTLDSADGADGVNAGWMASDQNGSQQRSAKASDLERQQADPQEPQGDLTGEMVDGQDTDGSGVVDLATIQVEDCAVDEAGATITIEDSDGTTGLLADGANVEITATDTQVEIVDTAPNGDIFFGTVGGGDDQFSGDATVLSSTGIECQGNGGDGGDGSSDGGGGSGGDSSCQNRHEVASLDELDEGDTIDFRTQGNKFRVSYDVFFDSNASNRRFRIEIRRNSNLVGSEETSVDQTDATFFVSDGSGNYSINATLSDAGADPTFDVTVDDCRGSNNNNNNNNNNDGRNRHHRHHDRNRHHDRDRDRNRFFGRGGAADIQYERIVEERVIKETIPKNKGRLAATGGVPLTGAALLGLASVGLGVSILRFAVRRES